MYNLVKRFGPALERYALGPNPIHFGFVAIIAGFVLCMAASLTGVGSIAVEEESVSKQVGFWYALNWSGTYLILYPIFLIIMSIQVRRVNAAVDEAAARALVFTRDGGRVQPGRLRQLWQAELKSASIILLLLAFFVAFQTLTDWWDAAGRINFNYLSGKEVVYSDKARDWSIAKVVNAKGLGGAPVPGMEPTWSDLLFGFLAYLYMGLTLFIYLSALVHSCVFSWFLHCVSESSRNSSGYYAIYRPGDSIGVVRLYLYLFFWMVFLGFLVMLFMRIQVFYLLSGSAYGSLGPFLFAHFDWVVNGVATGQFGAIPNPLAPIRANITTFTEVSSLALGFFALVALIFVSTTAASAVMSMQKSTFMHSKDADWLRRHEVQPAAIKNENPGTVAGIAKALVPEWSTFLSIVILVWISAFFPWWGSLFFVTCLVSLFVATQRYLRGRGGGGGTPGI